MKKSFITVLGVLLLLLLWEGLARLINSELILPSITTTLGELYNILKDTSLIVSLLTTFWRVILATILSVCIGGLLGFLAASSALCRGMIAPLVTTLRTVPLVALILITLMWFSSSIIPVFSGVVMGFPIITQNILVASDRRRLAYKEMATIFELSSWQQFRYIQFPEVMGYLSAGILATYGMCWKVVVAGEILAIPKRGLGTSMHAAMISLATPELIGYIVIAILCSALGSKILAKLLQSYQPMGEAL